jgi:hypothetical protein
MNLFEINRVLAVKLNQSFSSLYELPYYEYRSYLDFLLDEAGANTNQQFEIAPNSRSEDQSSLAE